jgi:hypothetical protein
LLASYTVNSTGDGGSGNGLVGDLRYCITQANQAGGINSINFSALFNTPQTITLTSGQQLDITDSNLTIMGPAAGVTVSGNNHTRVFAVESDAGATFWYMTITGGNSGMTTAAAFTIVKAL